MARNYGTQVEYSFANGLITDATGLNFPENAVTSANNIIFNEDGSAETRKGLDYEAGYQLNSVTRSGSAIVEYHWTAVAGEGEIEFIVQQIGTTLYFYRVSYTQSLSEAKHNQTVDISSFAVTGAPNIGPAACSFTSGKGYLFVTHPYCEPFFISYDPDTKTFATTQITIRIRDFEGVDDGLDFEERPTTLTDAHEYNLLNQGWYPDVEYNGGGGAVDDVITLYFNGSAKYPSNSEQWWLYRDTNEQFYWKQIDKFIWGNMPAPKGHFILNPFDTDRASLDTRIGTVTDQTSGYERPSCCAFFAGRVFYGGVNSSGYTGKLYFTQIIERDEQFGWCYQQQDPTSEQSSDLLPSDGGVINILDMGQAFHLFPMQKALIVFASNGIWSISGSDVASFSAEDYTVKKISNTTFRNGLGIIDVLGVPVFWNEDGISTVVYQAGDFTIQSLSDQKIKTYLSTIPLSSVFYSKGAYSSKNKTIYWLYSSVAPSDVDSYYEYDRVLCLNTITGAFYPFTVTSATKTINGIISVHSPDYDSYSVVTDSLDATVTTAAGDVYTFTNSFASIPKFFVTKNVSGSTYNSTWAEFSDTGYRDWESDSENVAYTREFFSGLKLNAEANKEFQDNYVVFYIKDKANSSAYVQGCWDFTNSVSSGKWTTAQQIYSSSPSYRDYRMKRLKIRGWGKALQFRVYGETAKPFHITGWSAAISGNQFV